MSLKQLQKNWDEFGDIDPLFAILQCKEKQYNKWNIGEFFETGAREIENFMRVSTKLGHPMQRESALDFGCGVGRLTRALSRYFNQSYGIDISASMIKKAQELNQSYPNCQFIFNDKADLRLFSDNQFDVVYTNLVLQHLLKKSLIKAYIEELYRVLNEDGLLMFQLPHYLPYRNRMQIYRWAYSLLRKAGLSAKYLYKRWGLEPTAMGFIPEKEVIALLNSLDASILEVQHDFSAGHGNLSRKYYVTKR